MLDIAQDQNSAAAEHYRELGELVWLASHSGPHRRMQIDEIEEIFLAPLAIGQLRRWSRGRVVVALATWAWLSEEAEATYLQTGKVPSGDWGSGDRLWFIDVIAPFGDARAVTHELRGIIPAGRTARSARWHADGTLRKVGTFRGRGAAPG